MARRKESNLLKQLREAREDIKAYRAGDESRVRVHTVSVPETVDVKKVRAKLKMSQGEFSLHYGFKAATVRDWEQGRRKPDRAARILLTVIDREPEVIERVLAKV